MAEPETFETFEERRLRMAQERSEQTWRERHPELPA